jgi:dTMP kinase
MPGKLIVLEGTDGSGKSTQFQLLCAALEEKCAAFRRIVFPQYGEESSALLRMYLRGDFGKKPGDVNAYAASTFYAVDRYASYKKAWGKFYEDGGLVLADRYTTSNAVHQASKLPREEWENFFSWLFDFEYRLLGLPRPDLVLGLDMPTQLAVSMLRDREGKTGTRGDIHETDTEYLALCREAARCAADLYCWRRISCAEGGAVRAPEEIHAELLSRVKELLP